MIPCRFLDSKFKCTTRPTKRKRRKCSLEAVELNITLIIPLILPVLDILPVIMRTNHSSLNSPNSPNNSNTHNNNNQFIPLAQSLARLQLAVEPHPQLLSVAQTLLTILTFQGMEIVSPVELHLKLSTNSFPFPTR